MSIIDRIRVTNWTFISTVLAINAREHDIPATAVGEMRCAYLAHRLFDTLGGSESMVEEYVDKVLRRQPPGALSAISSGLSAFLDNPVDHGLLHKYELSAEDLVSNWTFECLEDPTIMEKFNVGASVECEHHARWKKSKKDTEACPIHQETEPEPKPSEMDSLLSL